MAHHRRVSDDEARTVDRRPRGDGRKEARVKQRRFRRMLFGEPTKVAPEDAPSEELVDAKLRLLGELSRADRAIRAAMGHADEIFRPGSGGDYRGPERRSRPRPTQ